MGRDNYYLLTNLVSEEEKKVLTSIISHIEHGDGNVGIQQIANENFISPASIVKFCQRLGYGGYRELFFHLATQVGGRSAEQDEESPFSMIDNCSEGTVDTFCLLLDAHQNQKMYAIGTGFAEHVAAYMVHRLSICGFTVFNSVHFYDYLLLKHGENTLVSNMEPSLMIAVSQSGESNIVLNDVLRARQQGFHIVSFTRRAESTLVSISDAHFLINESRQALVGNLPNSFFGKVIIAFEELVAEYLRRQDAF